MKNVLILFSLIIIVLFSACKKIKTSNQPTSYRIDSVKDIVIGDTKDQDKWVFFKVVQVGDAETVTLSYEGLPPGIIIDPNVHNQLTGTTGFTGLIHLIKTDTNNIDGTYNIKLVCSGSVTGRKYYDLHLKVQDKKKLLGATSIQPFEMSGTWDGYRSEGHLSTDQYFIDDLLVADMGADPNTVTSLTTVAFAGWAPDIAVTINFNTDCSLQLTPKPIFLSNPGYGNCTVLASMGAYSANYMAITVVVERGIGYDDTSYVIMTRN